jgi:hydroxymethylbilane synthase
MTQRITVATRRSLLALTQTRAFIKRLHQCHPELEIEELQVTTTGDLIQDRPLNEVGGKGLFIKEIEVALLEKRADFAVHSMKDVPAELAPGLKIACVPEREDPRDAWISASGVSLSQLPQGAKIGSSSLRRVAQLRALRPDFEFVALRGNVDTRIRRCHEGAVDAIVLAMAGLSRLGWLSRVTEGLAVEQCLPAVGQGALAIECRTDDTAMQGLLSSVSDATATVRIAAERGVQLSVGGGCHVPLAAFAEKMGETLRLRALLANDSGRIWRCERSIPWPTEERPAVELGENLGQELLDASAKGV